MQSRWILSPLEQLNGGVAWREICGSDCIARLLARKGFTTPDAVGRFLRPRLNTLSDPFLLPQMEAAVARILRAIDRSERIVLFGDYDVDGVTSLALLTELLQAYGASPALFLPARIEEGYGLSRESVERCLAEHKPELLVAVDCGTSSLEEIDRLQTGGIDVIVLDHHEPKAELPNCVALVNPKQDPDGPFHYLCSVGIAFKLCHALLKTRARPEFNLKEKLDLVALGTVADIVPLHDENRIFAHRGAREIGTTARIGLRKLMEVASVQAPVTTEDIGFRIGPRLNAAGRLTTAEKSLRLLLTHDAGEADALAECLETQNRQRQDVEKQTFIAAQDQIAHQFDPASDAAIVVYATGWHPGVLGIVASRIARKYHRPAIVIGFDQAGMGKGSGRSIEGLNLVKALERCGQYLEKFGGHEMAAGLSVSRSKVEGFATAFKAAARESLCDDDLQPRLRLDYELSLAELNLDLLGWHEMLQPFGNGNPQPLFFASQIEAAAPPKVLKDKHLVLRLRQQGTLRRAVYFDGAAEPLPPPPWDIAFRIGADDYDGERLVQMQLHAVRSSSGNSAS